MALSFNVPSSPSSYYPVTIEQQVYKFTFRWQTRTRCWFFSIQDSDGVYLCKGAKLVPNINFLQLNKDKGPEGAIFVNKMTNDTTQIPGRRTVGPGKDFELIFYNKEELANVS